MYCYQLLFKHMPNHSVSKLTTKHAHARVMMWLCMCLWVMTVCMHRRLCIIRNCVQAVSIIHVSLWTTSQGVWLSPALSQYQHTSKQKTNNTFMLAYEWLHTIEFEATPSTTSSHAGEQLVLGWLGNQCPPDTLLLPHPSELYQLCACPRKCPQLSSAAAAPEPSIVARKACCLGWTPRSLPCYQPYRSTSGWRSGQSDWEPDRWTRLSRAAGTSPRACQTTPESPCGHHQRCGSWRNKAERSCNRRNCLSLNWHGRRLSCRVWAQPGGLSALCHSGGQTLWPWPRGG